MPSNILITGGTGLVGTKLTKELQKSNHQVNILTTSATKASEEGYYYWNIKDNYIDLKAFEGVEYLVHLAGAGVADRRWTQERKKVIYDSRIYSTALLVEKAKQFKIRGVVCSSAVGIYGFDTGNELLTEESNHGSDFLAKVVEDWEQEVNRFDGLIDFVMKVRIGVVLSSEGGALTEMITPFKFGLGSPLATGDQWLSWIHIDDLVSMIIFGIENQLNEAFNAVGPDPVQNQLFSKTLANTLNKPMWLPNVPSFILKLIFGELANLVVGGNRVSAEKIEKVGFQFRFPNLEQTLKHLLNK